MVIFHSYVSLPDGIFLFFLVSRAHVQLQQEQTSDSTHTIPGQFTTKKKRLQKTMERSTIFIAG